VDISKLQTVWLYNPSGMQDGGMSVDQQLWSTMQDAKIKKPPLAGQSTARVEMILTDCAGDRRLERDGSSTFY
jgi:hypothetical protein